MTDKQTPTIVQLISTFSDYNGAIGRLHQDALTAYVDKHVELFAELKPLITEPSMKAPALGAVLRKMASDAGKLWTLRDDNLATVLWFGRWHTAKRLSTYSGAKIKAEETPTISGYRGWLGQLSRQEIGEDGVATQKGVKAVKDAKAKAASLAVAKPAMVTTVDYTKDMEGLAELEQYRALLLLKVNLEADIATLERKLQGRKAALPKAAIEVRKAVSQARAKAAAS